MKKLLLTFYQRVLLSNLIGAHSCDNIRSASVFVRLLEKVRLTDIEAAESQFAADGAQMSWRLSHPNYGTKDLDLETDEAAALSETIEKAQGIRVADALWMAKLADELKPVEAQAAAGVS